MYLNLTLDTGCARRSSIPVPAELAPCSRPMILTSCCTERARHCGMVLVSSTWLATVARTSQFTARPASGLQRAATSWQPWVESQLSGEQPLWDTPAPSCTRDVFLVGLLRATSLDEYLQDWKTWSPHRSCSAIRSVMYLTQRAIRRTPSIKKQWMIWMAMLKQRLPQTHN